MEKTGLKIEQPHVGSMIEKRLVELGMTKAEFGRRINTSRQNVNSLLQKQGLETGLLWRISIALDFDFFQCISAALGFCPPVIPDNSKEVLRLSAEVQEAMAKLNRALIGED